SSSAAPSGCTRSPWCWPWPPAAWWPESAVRWSPCRWSRSPTPSRPICAPTPRRRPPGWPPGPGAPRPSPRPPRRRPPRARPRHHRPGTVPRRTRPADPAGRAGRTRRAVEAQRIRLWARPPRGGRAHSFTRRAARRSSGENGLGVERGGDRLDHRGDLERLRDGVALHAGLAQHLLVRVEAHAAAVDGGDREGPELEVDLVDARVADDVHPQAGAQVAILVVRQQVTGAVED